MNNCEFNEKEIVYLRHLKFPGTRYIDYRMNARPYLIYQISDDDIYMFRLGSSERKNKKIYYVTKLNPSTQRQSCIDLRYLIKANKNELEDAIRQQYNRKREIANITNRETMYTKTFQELQKHIEKYIILPRVVNYSQLV